MLKVHIELRQSDVLRAMLLEVCKDGIAELLPPLTLLLPHISALLLHLIAVKFEYLLAFDPKSTKCIVDERCGNSELLSDVPGMHALQMPEEHSPLLLVLLKLTPLELALGEMHPVLQPPLDTNLFLIIILH